MADQLLVGAGDVWPRLAWQLTGEGRPRTGAAYLAIAYIGANADNWLYLRENDVLVCDASKEAVSLGLTNVDQLRRWRQKGVKLYSREGLHAKTGAIGGKGFVGSANASRTSAEERNEAVLMTSSSDIVAGIRSYVRSLRDSPSLELDDLSLGQLSKITPKPPRWPRGATPAPAVPETGRLWLVQWEPDARRSPQEARQLEDVSKRREGVVGRADRIVDMRLYSDGQLRGWRDGDLIIFCNDDDLYVDPPAVVVDRERAAPRRRPAVFYRVRGDLKRLRRQAVEDAALAVDPSWRQRPSRTQVTGAARQAIASLDWYKSR
ncbi:hypothetical protein [Micromonospora tulbaghiae]|uniref:hypothetical protein n=1 Tax=Micromonospora tulbaghiae TaxID=479978 RepID=UPI00342508B7